MTRNLRLSGAALGAIIAAFAVATPHVGHAQGTYDSALLDHLTFRNVGPMRGGRATAGVGVPGNNQLYYMGATGGGVWKTEDAGVSWHNISDGFFNTGSIGDIAVYAGDPNIIYVGTGEAPVRGQMSSYGDGVYKSTDAGKTWKHVGLEKTMQISRVVINPTNPNLVYVAAQGNRWAPSEDRGIYKSTDGGATWKKILFSSNIAGASELQMDPYDPNVLYAAFWDMQRTPWEIRSGGPGSGIWKSTDGGEHWMKLTTGLPKLMGKIRLAVSPANDSRIYAAIENEKSGMFRSDDAGRTWTQVNDGGGFATRPWYYLGVTADPKNVDTVYVNSASIIKSTDGGKTFTAVPTHHTDTHTLWINPADPENMIDTDDGGGEISFNGGKTWSSVENQPTAQLYNVRADDLFPYNLYSGQQDSGSLQVPSRSFGGEGRPAWRPIAGNEAARPSFDPKDPRFVYTSNYQGTLTRTDMQTELAHDVSPWPGQKLGYDAAQMTYRFEWSPPTNWSPFDPNTIYMGGNVLFRTRDAGVTWDVISPDLTRNNKAEHGRSGLWWHDGSGGEIYNTIYAVEESHLERGTIWVGSDDGLVHLTRDDGKTWANVTPKNWPEGWVYTIEPSSYDKGTAYVTLSAHRSGDMRPHMYKTTDYGKTWTDLAASLPQDQPARVLREDPKRKGLLYAATEYNMYISFDGGAHWQSFQQNLPHVPFSDLLVHDNDLLVSTEGRGFWILDDVTTLRQLTPDAAKTQVTLFKPRDTYRIGGGGRGPQREEGTRVPTNPPAGVIIRYALGDAVPAGQTLKLDILDAAGTVVRSYTSAPPPKAKPGAAQEKEAKTEAEAKPNPQAGGEPAGNNPAAQARGRQAGRGGNGAPPPAALSAARGLNQEVWDFRGSPVKSATGNGPMMPMGHYTARMTLGSATVTQAFDVVADPRGTETAETDRERMELTRHIMEVVAATNGAYNELRDVLKQAHELEKQAKDKKSKAGSALTSFIANLEQIGHHFQPPSGPGGPGSQMVLTTGSGPVAQFGSVQNAIDTGEGPIDQGDKLREKEVEAMCVQVRTEADTAMNAEIPKINAVLASAGISPAIARHPGVAAPPRGGRGEDDLEDLETSVQLDD